MQTQKEETKLSLFTDDRITYIEIWTTTTKLTNRKKKASGTNKQFSKVEIDKSTVFLYTSDRQVEFEIKKMLPSTLAILQNEILRYKPNNDTYKNYEEKHNILMKYTEPWNKWRAIPCSQTEKQYYQHGSSSQLYL